MQKCSRSCLCSGTNRSTEHFQDYLAIDENELTLSDVTAPMLSTATNLRANC